MCGVQSLAMICFVFFRKFRLPIGLHSSCIISPTASGTCQNCSTKYHEWGDTPHCTSKSWSAKVGLGGTLPCWGERVWVIHSDTDSLALIFTHSYSSTVFFTLFRWGWGLKNRGNERKLKLSFASQILYRVTRQLESYIMLQSIWGVPPACGPLLQLATAQAGRWNIPDLLIPTLIATEYRTQAHGSPCITSVFF